MIKYTVRDIVKRAEQLADLENSDFISWKENFDLINEAWRSLYQDTINNGDNYNVATLDKEKWAIGNNYYKLPNDFYQLKSIVDSNSKQALSRREPTQSSDNTNTYEIINNVLQVYTVSSVDITYYKAPQVLYLSPLPKEVDIDFILELIQDENIYTLLQNKRLLLSFNNDDVLLLYRIQYEGENKETVNSSILYLYREGQLLKSVDVSKKDGYFDNEVSTTFNNIILTNDWFAIESNVEILGYRISEEETVEYKLQVEVAYARNVKHAEKVEKAVTVENADTVVSALEHKTLVEKADNVEYAEKVVEVNHADSVTTAINTLVQAQTVQEAQFVENVKTVNNANVVANTNTATNIANAKQVDIAEKVSNADTLEYATTVNNANTVTNTTEVMQAGNVREATTVNNIAKADTIESATGVTNATRVEKTDTVQDAKTVINVETMTSAENVTSVTNATTVTNADDVTNATNIENATTVVRVDNIGRVDSIDTFTGTLAYAENVTTVENTETVTTATNLQELIGTIDRVATVNTIENFSGTIETVANATTVTQAETVANATTVTKSDATENATKVEHATRVVKADIVESYEGGGDSVFDYVITDEQSIKDMPDDAINILLKNFESDNDVTIDGGLRVNKTGNTAQEYNTQLSWATTQSIFKD